ncbi:MAG: hypothetical protein AAF587_15615, partial [Bacteroidota bacterium]
AAHRTIRLAVFTQLFAAKKLQRNLKTKEKKKCTVVNKFSMRINQHHPKTAKCINSKRRFPEHMGGFFSNKNGQSQT